MPAAPPALPRTWRPLGPRVVGTVLGLGLVAVLAAAWLTFDAETRAAFTLLQRATVIGFVLLGLLILFGLMRSRVTAERDRLVVVNGFRRREYSWPQVVAVHLPPGAPWVTLDLADGGTASALGIQGSDGERSRRAVRELRALVADPPG
ncbi:PH domain-containing protein [Nocardioides sp. SYSU DS0663]|uniref:PH domain-containing protein n=1 Tax=Nocardioides sp. SYSU DS0663 TaxID=3416445 RepID=UPI003F4B24C4